jgi:transcriptional regulator with XRE-family HTH domain
MEITPFEGLAERLSNIEYAKLYGEEHAKSEFAITLLKARKSANLTQNNLAERLGKSQAYVAKLEGGESNPTIGSIGRLLAIIGLRIVMGVSPLVPDFSDNYMVVPQTISNGGESPDFEGTTQSVGYCFPLNGIIAAPVASGINSGSASCAT